MNPTLCKGDILIWKSTKIDEIDIGDIVVFKSYIKWPYEKLIAHRVTNIMFDKKSDELVFETKGDSNKWKDQDNPYINIPLIKNENIKGKVLYFGNQPLKVHINFLIFLSVILIIFLVYIIINTLNKHKKNDLFLTNNFF